MEGSDRPSADSGAVSYIPQVRAAFETISRARGALLALALLGSFTCDAKPARWNVLVLVPDTVRADRLSINGHVLPTSPVLEGLAREGANFTQTITVAPRTWQSFASILTGLP